MMRDWLDALLRCERTGTPAVLVTVLETRGSTPREAGAKMVVTPEGQSGTIGGGNLEFQSVRQARALLAAPPAGPVRHAFPLGPALGQCCGGHASVLFEVFGAPALRVALFGAGHVGRAVAGILGTLDCRLDWIDSRADAFPDSVPRNARAIADARPADRVAALPPGCTLLVMTHDHALDFEIVQAALSRDDLPFVGLIGSETKRARFVARLRRIGLDADAEQRLVCPIGAPGIGGKLPAEIAVAVAAQLLQQFAQPARSPAAHQSCAGCAANCATEPAG